MNGIRAILFDLHDTLVGVSGDNWEARCRAAYEVLREVTGSDDFASFYAADVAMRAELYGPGNSSFLDFGVTHRFRIVTRGLLGRELPSDVLSRMVEAYIDVWIGFLVALPGTSEALDRLGERYRLALVTDFGDEPGMHRILDRFGLARRFDPVVISCVVGRSKPHPLMFERALAALGISPAEAIHVGDNLVCDVEGACRAGIRPILMDYAGRHPEFAGKKVGNLGELVTLLEGGLSTDSATDSTDDEDQ